MASRVLDRGGASQTAPSPRVSLTVLANDGVDRETAPMNLPAGLLRRRPDGWARKS